MFGLDVMEVIEVVVFVDGEVLIEKDFVDEGDIVVDYIEELFDIIDIDGDIDIDVKFGCVYVLVIVSEGVNLCLFLKFDMVVVM